MMGTRPDNKNRRRRRWVAIAAGAIATATPGARGALDSDAAEEAGPAWNESPVLLPNTLNRDADDRYAAHRSHSSHSSHRSHRSSSGGSRSRTTPSVPPSTPQAVPRPAPAQPVPQQVPGSTQVLPRPTQQDLSVMVVRVQAALMRLGYYHGDVDGLLGPLTRAALKSFQKAQGLTQTGRMDLETLSRLGIPIP